MNNSNLIFLHRIIYAFGNAMIKVYVPIIIYLQTNSMFLALLFVTFFCLFAGFFANVLRRSIQKNNILYIILQIIPTIAIPILIPFVPMTILFVFIIALLSGLANALYFPALNYLFAKLDFNNNAGKFEIGRDLGEIFFLLISGFILGSSFSNSTLIVCSIAVFFYLISVIPLIFCFKYLKGFANENLVNVPLKITHRKLKPYDLIFASMGFMLILIQYFMPLYLYKINLNIESLAIVLASISLGKIILNYLVQKLIDKKKILLCCIIASIMFVSSSIAIVLIQYGFIIYILSIVLGLSCPLFHVSSLAMYCKDLESNGQVADGIVLREMYILYPVGVFSLLYLIVPSFLLMFFMGIISGIFFPIAVNKRLKFNEKLKKHNLK